MKRSPVRIRVKDGHLLTRKPSVSRGKAPLKSQRRHEKKPGWQGEVSSLTKEPTIKSTPPSLVDHTADAIKRSPAGARDCPLPRKPALMTHHIMEL